MISKGEIRDKAKGERPFKDSPLHVAFASSEIAPFARTGGLGEVLGSLPAALEQQGLKSCLIMPAYRSILRSGIASKGTEIPFTVPISNRKEEGTVLKTKVERDIPLYLVRADRYFDREDLYGNAQGDYQDNAERFTFFSRAILEVLKLDPPLILHAHDWQSALAIVFLKAQPHLYPELASVKTILTIHNLGYQGLFPAKDWPLLSLDSGFFTPSYLEFYDKVNFLKGGITLADVITTVSPTYAREIRTVEQGFGLEGVFQERSTSLTGILNGIDYETWNPETDTFISQRYGARNPSGKKACKADLQRVFCLPENPDIPLMGMVTRLTNQKGIDLLEKAMEEMLCKDIQFVLLGTGDRRYQEFFNSVACNYPEKVGIRVDFNDPLAHRIIAGSDLLLVPSHYEPCGLTQLQGLRYGTIPVVRATGGLADTIKEFDPERGEGNGFVFFPYKAGDLLQAIERALALYHRKEEWTTLVKNALSADFSWDRSAQAYLDLYQRMASVELK